MTDLKDTPEETDSTSSIICPWCFHPHEVTRISHFLTECHSCKKRFTIRITTIYHAKPVMGDKPKEDLSGVNSPLNWKWTSPTEPIKALCDRCGRRSSPEWCPYCEGSEKE